MAWLAEVLDERRGENGFSNGVSVVRQTDPKGGAGFADVDRVDAPAAVDDVDDVVCCAGGVGEGVCGEAYGVHEGRAGHQV